MNITGLRLDEISMVKSPANEHARVVLMKSKDDPKKKRKPTQKGVPVDRSEVDLEKQNALTTVADGHSHLVTGMLDYDSGFTDWQNGHDHPWIRTEDGEIAFGTSVSDYGYGESHTHEIAVIGKAAGDGGKDETEDDPMSDETKDVAKLQKRVDELEAEVETLTTERDALKAEKEDEVVYTGADGETYRKSDDPRLVKLAKQHDERAEELKAEKFRDTAKSKLSHLPGTDDDKVELLKAIDGIEDEDVRKRLMEGLVAKDGQLEPWYEQIGGTGVRKSVDDDAPEQQLDKMARELAKAEGIEYLEAYNRVVKTNAGKRLYSQSLSV